MGTIRVGIIGVRISRPLGIETFSQPDFKHGLARGERHSQGPILEDSGVNCRRRSCSFELTFHRVYCTGLSLKQFAFEPLFCLNWQSSARFRETI
jgi:hypothetical protein